MASTRGGLSIEAAIRWAGTFAEREWPLLLPVALAFLALPAFLFQLAWPDGAGGLAEVLRAGSPRATLLTLLAVPLLIVNLFGLLTLAGLAMVPGISVGEAIRLTVRRFPAVVLATILVGVGIVALMIVGAIVLTLVALGLGAPGAVPPLALLVLGFSAVVAATRLTPFVPLMVEQPMGPLSGLRRVWRITHGQFWRLLGFGLVFLFGSQVLGLALSAAAGSVILLAGKLLGIPAAAKVLVLLLLACFGAVVNAAYLLISVGIYRQLAGR